MSAKAAKKGGIVRQALAAGGSGSAFGAWALWLDAPVEASEWVLKAKGGLLGCPVREGDAIVAEWAGGSLVGRIQGVREERSGELQVALSWKAAGAGAGLAQKTGGGPGELRRIPPAEAENALKAAGLHRFGTMRTDANAPGLRRHVRSLLTAALRDNLLGPAGGPEEEVIGVNVRDRYVVGRLAPREPPAAAPQQPGEGPADAARDDIEALENEAAADALEDRARHAARLPDEPPPLSAPADSETDVADPPDDGEEDEDGTDRPADPSRPAMFPSTLGLTFCVEGAESEVRVEASWGHYERTESALETTEDGRPLKCWKRCPVGGEHVVALREGGLDDFRPDARFYDVVVRGRARRASTDKGAVWLVTLFLENRQVRARQLQDAQWLFQAGLRVRSGGAADRPVFVQRTHLGEEQSEASGEDRALRMTYRRHPEFVVGHSIGVHAAPPVAGTDGALRSCEVRTEALPMAELPVSDTNGAQEGDRPALRKIETENLFDMRSLAREAPEALKARLAAFADDYQAWIDEQQEAARRDAAALAAFGDAATATLLHQQQACARMRQGIQALFADPDALEAFRFMNEAMADQRIHSLYAAQYRREKTREGCTAPEELDKEARNHKWRPFQLAFILLSLPGLIEPSADERSGNANGGGNGAAIADLLWVPTGGGKTEAYLGLAAFAMAIRRLKPDLGGLDGGRGLAVIMRYTLRLLTTQQFQRAATLLCAMELRRRKDRARWGREPFTLGLWVGQKTTPNTTEQSADAIRPLRARSGSGVSSPVQLTTCPWCGGEISPLRDIRVDRTAGLTRIFCGAGDVTCPFGQHSAKRSPQLPGEAGLPVQVVDEELYRHPPSMLISTVDKFAMIAWKGAVRSLFGRGETECSRHGFILPDQVDCTGRHPAREFYPATPGARTVPRRRPPDLIIQDEFHLISGPLGSLVGLYETAVDELCAWRLDNGREVRAKVVASTATTRMAAQQMQEVFARQAAVFPPPGLDVSDNYFNAQRPPTAERPGRLYLGVCSPGMSKPSLQIRMYTVLLTAGQKLFLGFGEAADPYMTLVGYFNSLRELGGMRRNCEDDVRSRTWRTGRRVAEPGLAPRSLDVLEELTSRMPSCMIPERLALLETKHKDSGDYQQGETRCVDVMLATNMLSVGVDIDRLGLMDVYGQPKTTAEYIQSTSRIGRKFPGLVVTVLNWARPRDLSHYEAFEHYHETFYRHVEAQSVTPFSGRCLDRGLTGVMVGLERQLVLALAPNQGAGAVGSHAPDLDAAVATVRKRAEEATSATERGEAAADAATVRKDWWHKQAQAKKNAGGRLVYEVTRATNGSEAALLRRPVGGKWDKSVVPTSLRNVEPSVGLRLDARTSGEMNFDFESDHPWEPPKPPSNGGGDAVTDDGSSQKGVGHE